MSASSRKAERSKESEGKGKSSFDLSSLMEFPPMQSTSARFAKIIVFTFCATVTGGVGESNACNRGYMEYECCIS